MSWYYYSGNIVRSIQVSDSISVAVRPKTKIQIEKITKDTQAMINAGMLRKTGNPNRANEIRKASGLKMQDVVPKSDMAKYVAEKGVTSSKDLPPRKAVGAPEMTEHEASVESAPSLVVADNAEVLSPDVPDEGKRHRKRKRDSE